MLSHLHALIDEDQVRFPTTTSLEVYLGNYVDRGPQSFDVIERLLRRTNMRPVRLLRGNHDEAMRCALEDACAFEQWLIIGGHRTVWSYGVDSEQSPDEAVRALTKAVPEPHRRFLSDLEPMVVIGNDLFVHAGIRPGVSLDAQRLDDLLWIREPFLAHRGNFPHRVIHGHTIVHAPELHPNRIAVDTGAFHTGRLTCAVIEGASVRFLST